MTIADLQLSLFPAQERKPSRGGMPLSVERMWERAQTPAVREETLAILVARRGEWLGWNDFRSVIDRHQISSCFGHIISGFAREGLLQERKVYLGKGIGADRPGSPDYMGYKNEWSAV